MKTNNATEIFEVDKVIDHDDRSLFGRAISKILSLFRRDEVQPGNDGGDSQPGNDGGGSQEESHAPTVLVVDDGEENRDLINLVLSDAGIEVVTAENGQVALDYVSSRKFDVVLMDVQMPVMDGYMAAGKIRIKNPGLPVVALTADTTPSAEQRCLDAGYSHYMKKPIDIDVLTERVTELLGGEISTEHQAAASKQVNTSDVSIMELDAEKIYSSLPMSNKKYRKIVQKFVTGLEEQLAAFDDAWADRDYDELKRLGHWLKGSAGNVGFTAFIEPADEFVWLAISKDHTRLGSALSRLHSMYRRIEIQPEGGGDSQKEPHAMKDYVLPEKVTCAIIGISPRLIPLIEKFTSQLEDSLHDVDTAVGQNNFDEIRKFAEWLKAYGGTMGYGEFTEPAADLEASAKAKQTDVIKHTIGIIKDIQHRMVPLKSEHDSGTDLHLAMVGK
jgi:CheY-like chemotaxis protein